MSGDDLQELEIGEVVILRVRDGQVRCLDLTHNEVIMEVGDNCSAKVRGIDTWSKLVRVEFDDHNCHWVVPRLIERLPKLSKEEAIREMFAHSTPPSGKIKVIRRLDNGEECEWDCFWDGGWWSYGGGVRIPGVIAWFHPETGQKITT